MDFKNEYKKSIDALGSNVKLSAEDILKAAGETTTNEISFDQAVKTNTKKRGKKRAKRMLTIIAATIGLVGATAFAADSLGLISISDMFRKGAKDEVSADLVDQGFWETINGEVSADQFTMKVIGMTGDELNPHIAIDFYVENEELTSKFDKLCAHIICLGTEEYENRRDEYLWNGAVAYQDEENKNLYHMSFSGFSYWLSQGSEVVLSVESIIFAENPEQYNHSVVGEFDEALEVNPNLEYRFVPTWEGAVKKSYEVYAYGDFEESGLEYTVYYEAFSDYGVEIYTYYDYLGTEFAEGKTNFPDLKPKFEANYDKIAYLNGDNNIKIVVDGKDYFPTDMPASTEKVICDMTGSMFDSMPRRLYSTFFFEAIDCESAKDISVVYGDMTIAIKVNGEMQALDEAESIFANREQPDQEFHNKWDEILANDGGDFESDYVDPNFQYNTTGTDFMVYEVENRSGKVMAHIAYTLTSKKDIEDTTIIDKAFKDTLELIKGEDYSVHELTWSINYENEKTIDESAIGKAHWDDSYYFYVIDIELTDYQPKTGDTIFVQFGNGGGGQEF